MLKEKQLNDDLVTYKCARYCPTSEAKELLSDIAGQNEIPIKVEQDKIKVGGFFNSRELECLIISHPEHLRDYYRLVVVPSAGEVFVASMGTSKQMKKFAIAESAKEQRKGKSMSYKVGHMVGSSIWLLGKSKNKLEAEQNYYDALFQVVAVAFEVE